MPLINSIETECLSHLTRVPVHVDRHTLVRRRWRSQAEDGKDIAVDLPKPCQHGDCIYSDGTHAYFVEQIPETVIEIPLPDNTSEAAQLGWFLGNQHLPVEIQTTLIRLESNPQLKELLTRTEIDFVESEAVFVPAVHSSAHAHSHH